MARPKKTAPKRRQQQSSTPPKRTAVVWIAPNLERITKGERGRRGLTDPTGGYYLSLADLVLKEPGASKPNQPASSTLSGDEALFADPFPVEPESPSRQRPATEQRKTSRISSSKQLKSPHVGKRPKVERPHQMSTDHPKLTLPRLQPPKPPIFEHPKPVKTARKPKPPRHRD
jgi:hypothetical protein